jgi:hypothetical protein
MLPMSAPAPFQLLIKHTSRNNGASPSAKAPLRKHKFQNWRCALASIPPTNEAFLREVDDELRKDQLQTFWSKWGKLLIGGIVAILAAWGAWLWWENKSLQAAGIEGEKLSLALDGLQSGDSAGAESNLKSLATSTREGYRVSARLAQAGILLQREDTAGATKIFREIATDTSVAQPWRDLALIRQTSTEYDTLKPAEVIARLKPLAVAGNPWFGSAGEMVAVAYVNSNQPQLAGKLFADIGKDESVPETLRSRAVQMAGVLGVDAVNPAGKESTK